MLRWCWLVVFFSVGATVVAACGGEPADIDPGKTKDTIESVADGQVDMPFDAGADQGAAVPQQDTNSSWDMAESDTGQVVPPDGVDTDAEECESTLKFFTNKVWNAWMGKVCFACHNAQGAAHASKLVLRDPTWPNYLSVNLETVRDVAQYDYQGTSILLLKPTGQMNHGGEKQIEVGGPEYRALVELLDRFDSPVECEEVTGFDDFWNGVTFLDANATFRKAALSLTGRLPTAFEIEFLEKQGDAGLPERLAALLKEDAFYERLRDVLNDRLLTDRYAGGEDAANLLNSADYPNRKWWKDETYPVSEAVRALGASKANAAIAREALRLVEHVVRNDRPFDEIITADYTVANSLTAHSYGVFDPNVFTNPEDDTFWTEVKLKSIPHAGILTSVMVLNRFPTTDTNRNRHRSRLVWDLFLATDILALAEQPIDPTSIVEHNPTMFNPACTICHEVLDPVAGAFQNWTATGRYLPPENGWFADMLPPGFGDEKIPADQYNQSLAWLAARISEEPRFATAAVRLAFHMLTGDEPIRAPSPSDDSIQSAEEFDARMLAYDVQHADLQGIAAEFTKGGRNFKDAVVGVVMSPWFRADNAELTKTWVRDVELANAGTGRILTPEQLNRKIVGTLGYPWRDKPTSSDYLLSTSNYRIFYGGIDSDQITARLTEPNGFMVAVAERMAQEMSCKAVPRDFSKAKSQRILFPKVERTMEPEDANGFSIPQAQELIRENIRYLHERLLGETVEMDDPELDATVALFYAVWKSGKSRVAAGDEGINLRSKCQSTTDFWTGEELMTQNKIVEDANYTVRAWMAVVSYLLSDYRYLFE